MVFHIGGENSAAEGDLPPPPGVVRVVKDGSSRCRTNQPDELEEYEAAGPSER